MVIEINELLYNLRAIGGNPALAAQVIEKQQRKIDKLEAKAKAKYELSDSVDLQHVKREAYIEGFRDGYPVGWDEYENKSKWTPQGEVALSIEYADSLYPVEEQEG